MPERETTRAMPAVVIAPASGLRRGFECPARIDLPALAEGKWWPAQLVRRCEEYERARWFSANAGGRANLFALALVR